MFGPFPVLIILSFLPSILPSFLPSILPSFLPSFLPSHSYTRLIALDVFPGIFRGAFMNWFQTMFLKALPLELTSRLWDMFLLGDPNDGTGGVGLLFKVSLAVLTLFAPLIMREETEVVAALLNGYRHRAALWRQYVLGPDDEGGPLLAKVASMSLPDATLKQIATLLDEDEGSW